MQTSMFLSIPLLILTLFLSYHLYNRLLGYKLPPGPRVWPIVGNIYDIKPVRFRCYYEWAQVYGPIISVWFGSTLHVIVSNAELAREVLKDYDQQLADRARSRFMTKQMSRNGQDLVWADYGPHYVKLRKLCTIELFSAKMIEFLRPIREDEVTAMIEFIYKDSISLENNGKSLMLKKYLWEMAFNNITRLAFGKRFMNDDGIIDEQGQEFKAIIADNSRLGGTLFITDYIPWLRWLFPSEEEAREKHNERRDRLGKVIMEEHTAARLKKSGDTKHHFVDALLTLKEKYDLTEATIIGLLWNMVSAGTNTNVISVEWAMAELIRNQRVQQKAQEELDRVIGPERIMTELDFPNLPYLQAVAKEALRLHPPNPLMLPHRANTHVKIGGYDIPKGTTVNVNVWAVARDPAVWKDPLEFRPERFFEEDVDMKGQQFKLLPFGAGRRACPGAQLAINLVTSMLGHLLHHFTWSPPDGVKPEEIIMSENPGLATYMASPLQVVPCPRLPSELYRRVPAEL